MKQTEKKFPMRVSKDPDSSASFDVWSSAGSRAFLAPPELIPSPTRAWDLGAVRENDGHRVLLLLLEDGRAGYCWENRLAPLDG